MALEDPSPSVRLRAASALGSDGVPALRKLASIAQGYEETRASALELLCERVDRDEAIRFLGEALQASSPVVRVAAAGILGRISAPELLGALEQGARDPRFDEDARATFAEALANTSSPDAEGPLLAVLDVEVAAIRMAAARGLAKIGTRRAVEKLLPLTEGITLDSGVKREARRAIDAIQSRLAGAGAGQLAISEDPAAGALSEAEKPGGLALAKKQTT
jgi:HEAT repeat protein